MRLSLVLLSALVCLLSGCWGPRHPAPPFDPSQPYKRLQIVTHRGCHQSAPENTFAAAQACIDLGIDFVEVDVRSSADSVLFLMHDSRVDRTTDGSGWLGRLSAPYIDQLDAGAWFDAKFAGEKVPRLEDFLPWAKGQIKVYLDVKTPDRQQVVDLVRRHRMEADTFFWFGQDSRERSFRQIAPDLQLMTNVYNLKAVGRAQTRYNSNIVETELNWISREMVEACRQRGIKLMVFVGDDDPDAFEQVIRWRADMINLNHPKGFLKVQDTFFHRLEGKS